MTNESRATKGAGDGQVDCGNLNTWPFNNTWLTAVTLHKRFLAIRSACRTPAIQTVIVLVMLILAFAAGVQAWELNGKNAAFYQSTYRPAVSVACGHGFHNAQETRNPGIIQQFLTGRISTMTCADAFDANKAPDLLPLTSFNQQLVASQYLFGFLWRFGGIDWGAAKYVTGILVAGLLLATFAFSRLLLGFYPAIILASVTTLLNPAVSDWFIALRDFSKAPFMIGLAAFFAWIILATPRRLPLLGLGAAVTVAIGIGFRPDASIFLALVPTAFAFRMLDRNALRNAALGLLYFFVTAWAINAFLFNYAGALGRFNPHYVVLGQNYHYIYTMGFNLGNQGGFLQYRDLYAFGTVGFYSQFAGIPTPVWDSESYDYAATAYLLDTLTVFPANYLIEAATAAFKSLFPVGVQSEPFGMVLLLVTSFFVTAGFGRRGFAVLSVCLFLGGIAAAQFHPRHYFYLGMMGWVLITASIAVNATGLIAGRKYESGVRRFLVPAMEPIRLRYGMTAWAVLGLVCVLPLFLLRPYQSNRVADEIHLIESFPKKQLQTRSESAGTIVFDASGIEGNAYFSVREVAGSCAKFPSIDLKYHQARPRFDLPTRVVTPSSHINEVFFPSILEMKESSIDTITLSGIGPGCKYEVSQVEPNAKFLPLVFYAPPEAIRSYYYNRTLEASGSLR